jgi:hypothetical protein
MPCPFLQRGYHRALGAWLEMPAPLVAAHSMEAGLTRQEKNMLECFFVVLHSGPYRRLSKAGNGRIMRQTGLTIAAGAQE